MSRHAHYALLTLCAALAAACATPRHDDAENRDRHGPRDVGRYIERLESEERVAGLQVNVVIESLALPPDAVVGDLGCGPGIFAVALAAAVPSGVVYAADVEPRQLDALRARLAEGNVRNVVPVLASYDTPHFPPGRLDLIFIADTLHHFEERVAYLRALQGSLKAGGRLALLEYKPGDLPVGPPASRKLGPGELERTLSEAGYVRVERFETHPFHDFEVWRVRQPWER